MKKLILLLAALVLPIAAHAQSSQLINGSRVLPSGSSLRMQVANDASPGTTVNLLAKLTPTGAMLATTSDTTIPTFIVEKDAGTTNSAEIAVIGHGNCIMDTTTSNTEGFYVIASVTTNGRCHAQSSAPTAYIVGSMVSNSTTAGSAAVVQVIGSFNIAGAGSGTVTSIATTSPITGGTITTSGTIGCATCDTSAAALTDLSPVIGSGGGQGTKTVAGLTTDGVSVHILGVAGTSVGGIDFKNATSGTLSLRPTTGALGTVTVTIPALTDTLVNLTGTQTLSGKTLTTPVLGVATATSINKMAITAPATSSTLAVADGKTLTASNTLTLAGTDGTTITFQATDTYMGRATTDTKTNLTLDAEGTGNVITRPFYVSFSPACNNATAGPGAFNVPTSAAATFSCSGTTATEGNADFVDAATSGLTTQGVRLPDGWVGTVDMSVVWYANAASANAVRWQVSTGCVADSEAVNTGPTFNTASATNSAYTGTALQRKTTSQTTVAVTNCSAGETIYFKVERVGADGGDTLTATAELIELQVKGRTTK